MFCDSHVKRFGLPNGQIQSVHLVEKFHKSGGYALEITNKKDTKIMYYAGFVMQNGEYVKTFSEITFKGVVAKDSKFSGFVQTNQNIYYLIEMENTIDFFVFGLNPMNLGIYSKKVFSLPSKILGRNWLCPISKFEGIQRSEQMFFLSQCSPEGTPELYKVEFGPQVQNTIQRIEIPS